MSHTQSPVGTPLRLLALALIGLLPLACTYDYQVAHEQTCADGVDEDGDGLVDCDDPDCAASPHCIPETDCQNGLDDEGDGLTDCEDPDCRLDPICLGPRPCTGDGVCDAFEDCTWCDDCCPQCTLGDGVAYDYIAVEIAIPASAEESSTIGVDLDHDGVIDNALGFVLGLFDSGENANGDLDEQVQQGTFILLVRLGVEPFPADPGVPVQVFQGLTDPTVDATEDNLSGQGHALIDFEFDRSAHLCGALEAGALTTGPRPLVLPIGVLGAAMNFDLQRAQAYAPGPITAAEIPELHVGGGMDEQAVNDQLLPALTVGLNDKIRRNPFNGGSQLALGYVDSNCDPTLDGCAGVVNGQGDCAPWDGQPTTPPLSLTELRCNRFVRTTLQPDVDTDGDGVKDLLSIGLRLRAIPITIDN